MICSVIVYYSVSSIVINEECIHNSDRDFPSTKYEKWLAAPAPRLEWGGWVGRNVASPRFFTK